MTVSWQPVTSSWFGTCLVADCGLWLGTSTPPIPSPPLFPVGAPDRVEVDFVVGLPNPNGLVQDFHNGSYSAPNVADSWTYLGGGYIYRGGGSAAALDTGSHLFVVWYPATYYPNPLDIPPPSVDPLALVPAELAAGGLIKAASGAAHWSDWMQDPPEQVGTVKYRAINEAQAPAHGNNNYIISEQISAETAQTSAEALLVWGNDVDWGPTAFNKSTGDAYEQLWVMNGALIYYYWNGNWYSDISRNRRGLQVSAPSDWATQRNDLPAGLTFLAQGYDYGLIPGADPANPMSFIQYEGAASPSGVGNLNTWVGWTDISYLRGYVGHLDLTLTNHWFAYTSSQTFAVPGRLEYYENGFSSTSHDAVTFSNQNQTLNDRNANLSGPWPHFGGTLIATVSFDVLGASGDITYPSPSQPQFMLSAAVSALPPAIAGKTGDVTDIHQTFKNTPYAIIQKPRYRYWIPAGSAVPMRQKQRNDSLGRSTVRARGSASRQFSTRQRGYL